MPSLPPLQPYQWETPWGSNYNDGNQIVVHALDEQDNPYYLHVTGYPSHLQVILPFRVGGKPWSVDLLNLFRMSIINSSKKMGAPVIKACISDKKKLLYGDAYRKMYSLELFFSNEAHMRCFRKKLPKSYRLRGVPDPLTLKIGEDNVPLVSKILDTLNISACTWIECMDYQEVSLHERRSNLVREYNVPYDAIKGCDNQARLSHPGMLSFDLETYSHRHKKMPDALNDMHEAYIISLIYQRVGLPDTRKRIVLLHGDTLPVTDRFPDALVCKFDSEIETIEAFMNYILELDPEIITGYNIDGYDWNYLNTRISRHLLEWPALGRTVDKPSTFIKKEGDNKRTYDSYHVAIDGRVNLDLLKVMQKKYTDMRSYNLNYMANRVIGASKDSVTPEEMFIAYEGMRRALDDKTLTPEEKHALLDEMRRVTEYCIIDSDLVIDMMEAINYWLEVVALANICYINPTEVINRGQTCRGRAIVYRSARNTGRIYHVPDDVEDIIYDFSGGHVFAPEIGIWRYVPILDFASLYPSIMIVYNICYTTWLHPRYWDKVDLSKYNELYYTVTHKETVKVMNDKGKLVNKVVETKERKKAYFLKREYRVGLLPAKLQELTNERRRVRAAGAVHDGNASILSYALSMLSYARGEQSSLPQLADEHRKADQCHKDILSHVLDKSNEEVEEYMRDKLDDFTSRCRYEKLQGDTAEVQQLALKVTSNAIYGFLGTRNGGLPFFIAAGCVTEKGREHIIQSAEDVTRLFGAKVVYGDTDSIMPYLGLKSGAECVYWGYKMEQYFNGIKPGDEDVDGVVWPEGKPGVLPEGLIMEFEKGTNIFNLRKKGYMYNMITLKGDFKMETYIDENGEKKTRKAIYYKGVEIVRRDKIICVSRAIDQVARMIMDGEDYVKVSFHFIKKCKEMLSGKLSPEDYTMTMGVNGSYSDKCNHMMKKFSQRLKQQGNPPQPGERLTFLFVEHEDKKAGAGDKAMLLKDYLSNKDDVKIDYLNCIAKTFNLMHQMYKAVYSDTHLANIRYKPKGGHLYRTALTISEMIHCLVKDGKSLSQLEMAILMKSKSIITLS